jgi:hypothetical protein
MKYNDKDTLQDHVLAVAGGILNIAMLFSAQFPESSVQFTDLRNSVWVHDGHDTKVAHTRLRFRFMGCGCNRFRRPKGWGPRVYREGNRTNRGRRTDRDTRQQGNVWRTTDKLESVPDYHKEGR